MFRRWHWQRNLQLVCMLLFGIGLLGLTPGRSLAATTTPNSIFPNYNKHWSGYHVTVRSGNISTVHGEWAIPCETKSVGASYGAHGTWIGLGGILSSTSIKLGSAVNLSNGNYSYLWYEGTDGVIHVLKTGLYCYPSEYVRATLYFNTKTGGYSYKLRVTYYSGLFTSYSGTGDIGFLDTQTAEWEDSRPLCNGQYSYLNHFNMVEWQYTRFIANNHTYTLRQYGADRDIMAQMEKTLASPRLNGSGFLNTWHSYGEGIECVPGADISF